MTVAAFAAAINLAPGCPDAWVNYGLAAAGKRRSRTAKRQAMLGKPIHVAASAHLGALLRLIGISKAGEALLRMALVHRAGNDAARLNIVAD